MKVKTILITQFALPYQGIGSWTTMYNYYLNQEHQIDIIIGPTPIEKVEGIDYFTTENTFTEKVKYKVIGLNRYQKILKILNRVIEDDCKYIIQLIDNHGLVTPLDEFLKMKQKRKQCYIQFFYHGYPPFYGNFESRAFFESLDEHVMLTYSSYKSFQKYYSELPCIFSVLHNGVNSEQFYSLNKNDKAVLRDTSKVAEDKLIFVWCSQDRPKKGLDFTLKVWRRLVQNNTNIELWIIGSNRNFDIQQVVNLGRLPNSELPKYYQMADFYLFPSLWQEGFGLSLVEALKCGCYCIASNNGGIPEVLNYGNYGKLIERPNFIKDWVKEIEESINEYTNTGNLYLHKIENDLYSIDKWCFKMNNIIKEAKNNV